MTQTRTEPCQGCGVPQTRLIATGTGAVILNGLRMWCGPCGAGAEEEERAESALAEQRDHEERGREMARARQRRSELPQHLWPVRFSGIDERPEITAGLALAHRWAAGDVDGAVMGGPVGVGKTRLAAAAANQMLARRQVRWYSVPLLLARLGTGGFDAPPRVTALEALTGTDALVLDDLDKARATEYAAEILFLAVDARCDGAAPLLVTTNLGPAELAARWPQPYGEAIASRLALLPAAHVNGPDRRIAARAGTTP